MTKAEVIQRAYGLFYEQCKEYIDENGWCNKIHDLDFAELHKHVNVEMHALHVYLWRPIRLHNLDHNNGWIIITKTEDVELNCEYHEVYDKYNHIHVCNSNETLQKWRDGEITCFREVKTPTHPVYTNI